MYLSFLVAIIPELLSSFVVPTVLPPQQEHQPLISLDEGVRGGVLLGGRDGLGGGCQAGEGAGRWIKSLLSTWN